LQEQFCSVLSVQLQHLSQHAAGFELSTYRMKFQIRDSLQSIMQHKANKNGTKKDKLVIN